MRKHGLQVLGLALMAAIGLMAFASAAQALELPLELGDKPGSGEAGFFLVNKATSPTGLTHQEIEGKQIGSGRLLIPEKKLEIACEEGRITEGAGGKAFIQNEYEDFSTEPGSMKAGGHGHATVLFLKCRVWNIIEETVGGKVIHKLTTINKACDEALNNGVLSHEHITANVLVLVRRHAGVTYLILEPLINSHASYLKDAELTAPFTTVLFGGTCSLPEKVNITGSLAVAAPAADAVKPVLKFETLENKAIQELLGTKLKFGASQAYIEAEAEVELVGKAGVAWGAM